MSVPAPGAAVAKDGTAYGRAIAFHDACDRRTFVCVAVSALVAGSCASVAAVPVRAPSGIVRLPLAEYPPLAQPGGMLRIRPDGFATNVFVVRVNDEFLALSPICQHLGCTVNVEGARFVCPCHGSTYDRDGSVLRGPTQHPLVRFPVEREGEVLVIRLEVS